MNAVIYFSPTTATKRIAKYSADFLNFPLVSLTTHNEVENFNYSNKYNYLVFCFPVYSQNIPKPVKQILKRINSTHSIIIATYGKMGTGNPIYEAYRLINTNLIGAAYIPTKHTYKEDDNYFENYSKLYPLLNKVKNNITESIQIPQRKKHIFANFIPNLRSRLGVKIIKTNKCTNCSLCNQNCPTKAINNGRINQRCIRCLRCILICPNQALEVKYSYFLKHYIKKEKFNDYIIYL